MTRKKVAFILVSFLAVVCLLLIPGQTVRTLTQAEVVELKDGWRMSYNGGILNATNPQRIVWTDLKSVKRNDVLTMTRKLPSSAGYYYPALYVRTNNSSIEVLINGVTYYTHDREALQPGGHAGSGGHFIDLPASVAGSELTIRLTAAGRFAFLGVEPPMLSTYTDVMEFVLHRNFLQLTVGIFLCMFGMSFLVISLYFVMQTPNLLGQVVSSLICIDVGIWLLSAYDLLQIIMGGIHTTVVERIALYMLIPLIYLYLSSMRKPFRKQTYTAIAVVSSALCISFVIGVAIGFLPTGILWIPYGIIALIATIIMLRIRAGNRANTQREESESLRIAGLLVLVVTFWFHHIFYTFMEYTGLTRDIVTDNLVTFGGVLFVLCLMLNYFVYIAQIYTKKQENETLQKIAYEDALTQLPNRVRIDEVLHALDESNRNFCIVSMDLNGLKQVNDQIGHMWGDHLLMEFAQVLRISFGEVGFLSRVGGDEFIVALEEVTEGEVREYLGNMIEKLELLDKREKNINHSVAYGYAFRTEVESRHSSDVQKLADARMYEMKSAQKKQAQREAMMRLTTEA